MRNYWLFFKKGFENYFSNFCSHVIEEGHDVKNVDNIMTTLHNENNLEKINKLDEKEILKEAASQNILNDVINGRNDPLYKILISVDS